MSKYLICLSIFSLFCGLFCLSCDKAAELDDSTRGADTATGTQAQPDTETTPLSTDTGSDAGTETGIETDTQSSVLADSESDSVTAAGNDTGTTAGSDLETDDSVPCTDGASRCMDSMVERCVDGAWQPWDDCSVYGQRCTVLEGVFQCAGQIHVDSSDTGTDSDPDSSDTTHQGDTATHTDTSETDSTTDSTDTDAVDTGSESCDGADVDCYTECWGCGLLSARCKHVLEDCLTDNRCALLYQCREDVCCNSTGDCLTGDDWDVCMADCADNAQATSDTLDLYRNIDKCVACDVCAISCAQNESHDFAMCASAEDVNNEENPCYAEDAEAGEVACFAWAGWGGPCTDATNACISDSDCNELNECISASWSDPNWISSQEQCFSDAGATAEDKYWDWMQCIYCDACDIACKLDAKSKNCEEYQGE